MKSLKYRITLWYSLFAIALTAMMLFAIVRIAHHNTDINVRDNLSHHRQRRCGKKQLIHKIRTWKPC